MERILHGSRNHEIVKELTIENNTEPWNYRAAKKCLNKIRNHEKKSLKNHQ